MLVKLDKTFKKMFTNTVKFTWRDEDNETYPHFYGFNDSVILTYLTRVNNIQDGGLRFVNIFVDSDSRLIARYQNRPFRNSTEINEDAYISILSENVESVSFQYAGVIPDTTGVEELEWTDQWEQERLDIPLGIMVTVNWRDKGSETFIWRTASNSYYERWGAWRNNEEVRR